MRVGLTLSGDLLNADGARFAAEVGAADIVAHLPLSIASVMTTISDVAAINPDEPVPDVMVWNMRYREGRASLPPVRASDAEALGSARPFLAEKKRSDER